MDDTKKSLRRLALTVIFLAGTTVVATAVFLHLIVKDSIIGLAMIHYGFPAKVLTLACVGLAVFGWVITWRKTAAGHAVCVIVCLGITVFRADGMVERDGGEDPDLTVAMWNISRGRMGYQELFDELANHPADVIGFVEFGDPSEDQIAVLAAAFPDHGLHRLPGNMAVLSRRAPDRQAYEGRPDAYRFNHLTFGSMEVVVVDINSGPLNDRRVALAALRDMVGDHERMVVMGDFNTPHATVSRWLAPVGLVSGSRADAYGGRDSWPYPLPVLAIDQIWTSPDWSFTSYSKHGTILSDHCLMKAELMRRRGGGTRSDSP